jgi:Na+/proline symporter
MFGLTVLDLVVLLSYFVLIIAIGFTSARLVRNREGFLMGGRRFGKVLMIFFSFGAGTHADSAVGVVSQCYKVGFAGIWYQWSRLFTLPIYWLMAPVFRRMRVLTTADYFERRFGPAFMLLYAFFALFICITFAGIHSNNIHKRVFAKGQDERRWIRIARVAAGCFALLSVGLSFCFTDVPAAMRFIWSTVPILGIPFFMGLLWRRCTRAGAFASVLAAFSAMLLAVHGLRWRGDVGLPKTVALFLGSGILAGIVVSRLRRRGRAAQWRNEQFSACGVAEFVALFTPEERDSTPVGRLVTSQA